jgi:hypothetical protein
MEDGVGMAEKSIMAVELLGFVENTLRVAKQALGSRAATEKVQKGDCQPLTND